mmetsp:Transcript_37815/g.86198  ORF Transcript_37815/g.86198 Transcript_37815/m.86198 type:complete len:649 (-) Transcript_37815:2499-4445(-)
MLGILNFSKYFQNNKLFKKKNFVTYMNGEKKNNKYDVIVIGGGHAGCEAALASAKMGASTLLLTLNLDKIGWQPCNPSIGGPAKSTLVQELDAMGGIMGKIADRTYLHKKILNISKGPAVWSLRAQTDKREYSDEIKKILDGNLNLTVKEGMVNEIYIDSKNQIKGIGTFFGGFYQCTSVVLTTGTFLGGIIWIGSKKISAGRAGEMSSFGLTASLRKIEIKTGRLKTGTPPRIDSRYINFDQTEAQPSDTTENWFSFDSGEWNSRNTMNCFLTYTNDNTRYLIRKNLHLSPKYGGFMKSTGPRYCPSIEDKIVRFTEKKNHQIFLEPEGRGINEVYVQGLSTGLPEKLQIELLKSISGLENSKMVRPAYSVDYDYIIATQLDKNLMSRIDGLFFAGQICGTTGYEEAASQGLIAGINSALFSSKKPMLSLSRDGSFIGTMIEDLCTKDLKEPYRVLTSRSEFRLLLRGDNADYRMMPIGRKYGLIKDKVWKKFKKKVEKVEIEGKNLNETFLKLNFKIRGLIETESISPIKKGCTLSQLISRPNFGYFNLKKLNLHDPDLNIGEIQQIEIEFKYLSYIERQEIQIKNIERVLDTHIDKNINFMNIRQLSKEGREKLTKFRPRNLREACKIGGVSTSDVQTLARFISK